MTQNSTKNSGITTLDASNLTYEFEKARWTGSTDKTIVKDAQKIKQLPPNLQYLDDFRDVITGTSGTAFLDKNSGEVIIAYTGTNPSADVVQDASADFFSILMAKGYHYESAYSFYDKIRTEYGSNITLTGHSLGGNIAQRVALEFDAPRTVVYNAAPLYLEGVIKMKDRVDEFLTPVDSPREKIINKILSFKGQVIRIRTEDDFLNNISMPFAGVYIGEDHLLKNSGGHSIDPDITGDPKQLNQIKHILEKQSPEKMTPLEKKHHDTLQKLQGIKNGLVASLINQFSSDGHISSHEMFFLDSLQATAVAAAISEAAGSAHSEIQTLAQKAEVEAEEEYNKSKEIPWFITELSYDEVQTAYEEAGVTYESIVGKTKKHFEDKVAASDAIVTEFKNLENNIRTGVNQAVAADESLAGDISQWIN